jgi:O-antigen ligase
VDQWYERELKLTADSVRKYEQSTYYVGRWKPEYERWVTMLAGLNQGPGHRLVAWNSALLYDMIFTQPVVYEFKNLTMPTLLMIMAMALMGALAPRLRLPLLAAAALAVIGVLALPVLSPPAYDKLVVRFAEQMSHFPDSPYGQLYVRAAVMVGQNPLLGLGFDGFRTLCPDPSYFHSLPALGIVNTDIGAAACNIHPHNYYMEVAVMSGLTGLAAFVAVILLWTRRIATALRPRANPEQAMLAVAFATVVWPIASTSSLFTFDTAGWAMLIIGWALAASGLARADQSRSSA